MGISLDSTTSVISITSPQTTVTIAELVTAIRNFEDDLSAMSYPYIILTDGKTDLKGGIFTAITLTLASPWQIQFWNGVTLGIVKDGNLVGGLLDKPVKPTGGMDTIIVNNQVGGTIMVSGGSVPSAEEIRIEMDTHSTKLTGLDIDAKKLLGLSHENAAIDNAVYDGNNNLTSARLRTYSVAGSVGTDSDVLATYTITSVGSGAGMFSQWEQVKS